ncbi:MAG: hypothetical protein N3B21_12030 [Clostridia bacterium]|nr:hypothetical protein [Clostridia bacterium]
MGHNELFQIVSNWAAAGWNDLIICAVVTLVLGLICLLISSKAKKHTTHIILNRAGKIIITICAAIILFLGVKQFI